MNAVRTGLCMVMLAALCGAAAAADVGHRPMALKIEAQPVDHALKAFAEQTGLQVLFHVEGVQIPADLNSPSLEGTFTPEAALRQLLANTGLRYEFINARTVTIRTWATTSSLEKTPLGETSGQRLVQAQTASTSPAFGERATISADEKASKVEEIVVTAQKRVERLKDVPISISVLTGKELDRSTVQGLTEALTQVPGVGINETYQGGGSQVAIRGVSASGALFNGSSPVSYYLDTVPFALIKQAVGPDMNAYDLDRVEVLRGPQGTLYGASSQNGVVRVLTSEADLNHFQFKGRVSTASTEHGGATYRADTALNLPLIEDRLAVRAVVGYQDIGGWIDRPNRKDANDGEIRNLRLRVNAQPSEALSLSASAWSSRSDFTSPSIANDAGTHGALNDEPVSTDFDAYGLRASYDLTRFSITSSTSYLDYANSIFADVSIFVAPPNIRLAETSIDAKMFAQELLLSSAGEGPWRWTLGAIYRDADDHLFQLNRVNNVPLTTPTDHTYDSRSQAVFGELTRTLADGKFEITGGLRYFEDEVTLREASRTNGPPPAALARITDEFTATSPRFVLSWHPSDNATVYGSYSEGFRSGAATAGLDISFPSVKPDTLHNYELGAKGSIGNGLLRYDASLYFIDWQDVQQSLVVEVAPTLFRTVAVNAESASGPGFDLGLTTEPLEGLSLGLAFSWNDLAVDSNVLSNSVVLFASDDRLNISPELTAGVTADYEFPLGNDLRGRLSASSNYTSEMDLRTTVNLNGVNVQRVAQGDSMFISRASFGVGSADRWTATLFVDNVTNEQGSPVRFPFLAAITDWNMHVRPRTIGIQLEYRFN